MTPGCTQRGLSWQRSRKRTKTSFNVVVWNPCSLIQAGRANDISCGLSGTYIVLLPGTRVRGLDDCQVEQLSLDFHIAINAGWRRGPGTNRSAGCTVLLR